MSNVLQPAPAAITVVCNQVVRDRNPRDGDRLSRRPLVTETACHRDRWEGVSVGHKGLRPAPATARFSPPAGSSDHHQLEVLEFPQDRSAIQFLAHQNLQSKTFQLQNSALVFEATSSVVDSQGCQRSGLSKVRGLPNRLRGLLDPWGSLGCGVPSGSC